MLAGQSMTSAFNNMLYGINCGNAITTGSDNLGFGINCMNALTTGYENCCFGNNCGNSLTIGVNNTFMGRYAGVSAITGNGNTFVGFNAGNYYTTGSYNTAIGERAQLNASNNNMTGNYNTSCGHYTMSGLTSGYSNTALGSFAGGTITTGIYNIYIGYNPQASGTNPTDEIVIGQSIIGKGSNTAIIKCAQNQMWFSGYTGGGTANFTGAGQLTNTSDRDTKNNITYLTNQGSIQKVLDLKPCTYKLNSDKYPDSKLYTGFIAQDVDEVIPTAVDGRKYKFQYEQNADGSPKVDEEGNVVYMKDENGNKLPRYLGLNITDILATSVLAIQEQQSEITDLKAQLSSLKATIDILLSKINN
jgi:hypothetical protein